MEFDIFYSLLWVTAILLVISGTDDLFMDVMYWFTRKKYNRSLPRLSEIKRAPEKPIALIIGAWQEEKVIGRTISIALSKIRYKNFKIFVGVYPNDENTIKIVSEFAEKDDRVVVCINTKDGPTSKADNLNNVYKCIKKVERDEGDFGVLLIHDSEDFIHPLSLKLFNYMIMYKGYHAIQIPVVPIKSPMGKLFHRTYCDAFAELHTKDMIVRQTIKSYMPFAGTGMGFNRRVFHQLEHENRRKKMRKVNTHPAYLENPFEDEQESFNEAYSPFNGQISKNERRERKYNNRRRRVRSYDDYSPLTGNQSREAEYDYMMRHNDDYNIYTGTFNDYEMAPFGSDSHLEDDFGSYSPYKGTMGRPVRKNKKKEEPKDELKEHDEIEEDFEDEEQNEIHDFAKVTYGMWLRNEKMKERRQKYGQKAMKDRSALQNWESQEEPAEEEQFEEYSPVRGWNPEDGAGYKSGKRKSVRFESYPAYHNEKKSSSSGVKNVSMFLMMVVIIGLIFFIYMNNIKPSNAKDLSDNIKTEKIHSTNKNLIK